MFWPQWLKKSLCVVVLGAENSQHLLPTAGARQVAVASWWTWPMRPHAMAWIGPACPDPLPWLHSTVSFRLRSCAHKAERAESNTSYRHTINACAAANLGQVARVLRAPTILWPTNSGTCLRPRKGLRWGVHCSVQGKGLPLVQTFPTQPNSARPPSWEPCGEPSKGSHRGVVMKGKRVSPWGKLWTRGGWNYIIVLTILFVFTQNPKDHK